MSIWRLTKEDCEDVGFAYSCLISGAISFNEFKQWLYLVVEQEDEVPNYVWDVLDIEEKFDFIPLKVMGFTPGWTHIDEEEDAIDGIAYFRDASKGIGYDAHIGRADAVAALGRNPQIVDRFNAMFPFIDWSMPSSS